jgi:TorA maturation chaperone TorD
MDSFSFAFLLLGKVFLSFPEPGFINTLITQDLFKDWPLQKESEATSKGLKLMKEFINTWKPWSLPPLKMDYTRLFVGLEKTLAPPYESVYLGREKILFEEPTLAVRKFYQDFGVQVSEKNTIPDDHIGMELHFLAYLCEKSTTALKNQDQNGYTKLIEAIKKFLSEHLNLWFTPFFENVIAHGETSYYKGAVYLTRGALENLSEMLGLVQGSTDS